MGFFINEAALPITFCESGKPMRSLTVETLGSIYESPAAVPQRQHKEIPNSR